jgi:hypothetical protein
VFLLRLALNSVLDPFSPSIVFLGSNSSNSGRAILSHFCFQPQPQPVVLLQRLMDADGASASCVESASASALSSSYKTYKDYMRAMLPNGDQWPLALLDGDQLPTLMDAEEIDGDEASWEQYLLEMKAYRKYMRAMLPKAEQETHDKYNFALAELKENDNLDEFDKETVRRFLLNHKLVPKPPTCPPPLSCTTAIGAGPPACAPLMQRSGTKRHHQTLELQAPACARPPCLRQGQKDTTGPSGHRGRPSGPRLQPSRGLSPE